MGIPLTENVYKMSSDLRASAPRILTLTGYFSLRNGYVKTIKAKEKKLRKMHCIPNCPNLVLF